MRQIELRDAVNELSGAGKRFLAAEEVCPDHTRDLGAAMSLFLQLRFGTIATYGAHGFRVGWGDPMGVRGVGHAFVDFDPFAHRDRSAGERLAITICAAYYERETGIPVVLIEDE